MTQITTKVIANQGKHKRMAWKMTEDGNGTQRKLLHNSVLDIFPEFLVPLDWFGLDWIGLDWIVPSRNHTIATLCDRRRKSAAASLQKEALRQPKGSSIMPKQQKNIEDGAFGEKYEQQQNNTNNRILDPL